MRHIATYTLYVSTHCKLALQYVSKEIGSRNKLQHMCSFMCTLQACTQGGSGGSVEPPFSLTNEQWEVGMQWRGKSNAHLWGNTRVQPVALFQQGIWSSQAFYTPLFALVVQVH